MTRKLLLALALVLALGCAPAFAATSFVNDTENAAVNGTSVTLATPTSCATDDALVFKICTNTDLTISDYGTNGFAEREASTLAASGFKAATRKHDGSTANWTFTFNGATEVGVAWLGCYTGTDTTEPFDLDGTPETGTTPHTTPAITPSQNDSMLVGSIFIDPTGTRDCTEISGFTLRADLHNGASASLCVADKLQTTATSEGVQITSDTATWGEYTLDLKPAAGGGGGNPAQVIISKASPLEEKAQ